MAIGAALLALAPIGMRVSEVGPLATAFWRFVFALPVLGAVFAAGDRALPKDRLPALFLAGLFFAFDLTLWHAALGRTSIVNATLATNMTPIITAAAGYFLFKERVKPIYAAGAGAALLGAVLLSFARAEGGGPMSGTSGLVGDLMGLGSAFWYALYLIIMRREREMVSARAAIFVTTFASAIVALALSLWAGEKLAPASLIGWLDLVALGLFVQAAGQGLIAYGIGRLPIALSTVLLWIQPVAAAALSWLFFGEATAPIGVLGAGLVLAGVFIAQGGRITKPAPISAPSTD